jgi:hypothetical protein
MSVQEQPEPQVGSRRRGRRARVLIVSAIILAAAVVVGYVAIQAFLGPGGGPGDPTVVAEFSGDGDQITTDFTVSGDWRIRWQTDGPRFAFAVRGERDLGTIITREGTANGVTSVVPSGTFRLEITAEGPWTVRIEQPR